MKILSHFTIQQKICSLAQKQNWKKCEIFSSKSVKSTSVYNMASVYSQHLSFEFVINTKINKNTLLFSHSFQKNNKNGHAQLLCPQLGKTQADLFIPLPMSHTLPTVYQQYSSILLSSMMLYKACWTSGSICPWNIHEIQPWRKCMHNCCKSVHYSLFLSFMEMY